MGASDQVRKAREDIRNLFSTNYFTAFLTQACQYFSEKEDAPFDLIRTSRISNLILVDLDEHLLSFLKTIQTFYDLINFIAPMIASTFLLDSYPSGTYNR
jgi:hypothetical protein